MTRYLLDTNILSDAMNVESGLIAGRLRRSPNGIYAVNPIIIGEIWFGLARRPSERRERRFRELLAGLGVLHVEGNVAPIYGHLRAALQSRGQPIGQNDLWIAAHALAEDLTLVTDNVGEFARVEGLRIENWLRTG